ncbi:Serine carboxypeptidase-like 48 [Camellia lanceoleosa]|uniref:Serine carboxypeptidase-like 48 n=1 Tax=Camellia lanceoleosa TaxID=1840588 RepID=A0ACC0G800_9ERIC|nr:Serine carboxypeptidase-like 48 [Camellia lanceoleosa]
MRRIQDSRGNSKWVHEMEWSSQKDFTAASFVRFTVHDAGHMVPTDQPKASLEMLKRWTQGKLSMTKSEGRLTPM